MLTITDNAAAAIRELAANQSLPHTGGLRIAPDPVEGSLRLALSATPNAGDRVLDVDGARIFLGGDAAEILDGHAIDVTAGDDGQAQFVLGVLPQ